VKFAEDRFMLVQHENQRLNLLTASLTLLCLRAAAPVPFKGVLCLNLFCDCQHVITESGEKNPG